MDKIFYIELCYKSMISVTQRCLLSGNYGKIVKLEIRIYNMTILDLFGCVYVADYNK